MQEENVGPQTEFHDSEDSLSTWALASDADDDRTPFMIEMPRIQTEYIKPTTTPSLFWRERSSLNSQPL